MIPKTTGSALRDVIVGLFCVATAFGGGYYKGETVEAARHETVIKKQVGREEVHTHDEAEIVNEYVSSVLRETGAVGVTPACVIVEPAPDPRKVSIAPYKEKIDLALVVLEELGREPKRIRCGATYWNVLRPFGSLKNTWLAQKA